MQDLGDQRALDVPVEDVGIVKRVVQGRNKIKSDLVGLDQLDPRRQLVQRALQQRHQRGQRVHPVDIHLDTEQAGSEEIARAQQIGVTVRGEPVVVRVGITQASLARTEVLLKQALRVEDLPGAHRQLHRRGSSSRLVVSLVTAGVGRRAPQPSYRPAPAVTPVLRASSSVTVTTWQRPSSGRRPRAHDPRHAVGGPPINMIF